MKKRHTLQPLSEYEKAQAEKHHNLVYSFLHRHGYSIEEYYNIVIFGYLKGLQLFYRRKDLQEKYHLAFICEQYMRAEIGNHFQKENADKRKSNKEAVSMDTNYADDGNLYDCTGGKSIDPESEIIEKELLVELLGNLSDTQRKITEMKLDGYDNKEVYLLLKIKQSTYYKELQRIRKALEELTN